MTTSTNSFEVIRYSDNKLQKEVWTYQLYGTKIVLVSYTQFVKEEKENAKFGKKLSWDVFNQSKNNMTLEEVPQSQDVFTEAMDTFTKEFRVMTYPQYLLSL